MPVRQYSPTQSGSHQTSYHIDLKPCTILCTSSQVDLIHRMLRVGPVQTYPHTATPTRKQKNYLALSLPCKAKKREAID